MKKGYTTFYALMGSLTVLAGCVTHGGDMPESSSFRRSETALAAARNAGKVECISTADCSRAWDRARMFVQRHSPTSIIRSTDDTIETRMPHEFGLAWFWATRKATANGETVIRLKGLCRGMYDSDGSPGWIYERCAEQLREAQIEFAKEVGGAP